MESLYLDGTVYNGLVFWKNSIVKVDEVNFWFGPISLFIILYFCRDFFKTCRFVYRFR